MDYKKLTEEEKKEFRECLASLCHEQWSGWMKYMFSKFERQHNGDWWIPKWAFERWARQMNTDYKDLTEEEKDSDREEADRFIRLLTHPTKSEGI